jgi:Ca-activated chloride channel family protein
MVRTLAQAAYLAALFLICSAAPAFQFSPGEPAAHIRVDSSLVLIPVHVTTPLGTTVTDLGRENFELFEDDVEQRITYFTKEDAPLSIGLLFDSSGSMHNKMRQSSEAAATFFKTANADDEFFLIEFNDRPKLTVPFTPDSAEIFRRIVHSRPFGRTSLLDAVHLALGEMKNARHMRKAIVVLSDGGDNRSRHNRIEIANAMRESDVQLYAMGIFDSADYPRHTPEERNGPQLLDALASETGGRLYTVDKLDDLPSISARIGNELRDQYLLGYSPANASRDGKYRHVKLSVTPPSDSPNLRMNYRHGYQAPAE